MRKTVQGKLQVGVGNAGVSDTLLCSDRMLLSGHRVHGRARSKDGPISRRRTPHSAKFTWTCKTLFCSFKQTSSQAAVGAERVLGLPCPFLGLMLLPRCLLSVSALTERKGSHSCLFLY